MYIHPLCLFCVGFYSLHYLSEETSILTVRFWGISATLFRTWNNCVSF